MKRWIAAALCALLTALLAPAAAQTLPDVACFSPGLVRVSETMAAEDALRVEAWFSVTDALYARDLSVFSEMLAGTKFVYEGFGDGTGADRLRIERTGVTLLDAALARDGSALALNGQTLALADGALDGLLSGGVDAPTAAMLSLLNGVSLFERAPLARVAAWIQSLSPGDALPGGLVVVRAFSVEPTFSDDGTRLTRIDIDGALMREGEKPYAVTGWLRQPAGRAPKDTFEITAKQDEDNYFTLTYASTRSSEIVKRDRQGKATVQTTLRSDGELAGSRVSSKLTVRLTNDWTADETGLAEKITVSASLGHTDRTPGRRMQRLNDIAAELRAHINLRTGEDGAGEQGFVTDATLSVTMDGNTFLTGGMTAAVTAGAKTAFDAPQADAGAHPATGEELEAAAGQALRDLAAGLYAQLSEKSLEKIGAGL